VGIWQPSQHPKHWSDISIHRNLTLKQVIENILCRHGWSLILPAYRDPRSTRAIKASFIGIPLAPNVSASSLSIEAWPRHYQDND
jgi:hypothetical protein